MPHRAHRITIAAALVALCSSPSTLPAATAAPAPPALVLAQAAEEAEVDVGDRALIRSLQQALRELGFDPGPIDGLIGPRTRSAVREYQRASGLPDDGRITKPLLADIARRITAAR